MVAAAKTEPSANRCSTGDDPLHGCPWGLVHVHAGGSDQAGAGGVLDREQHDHIHSSKT